MDRLKQLGVGHITGAKGFSNESPSIIMVHGAGGRTQIWQNQIPDIGKSYHTVAIDLPGHGNTPGIGNPSIEEYAKWLMNIIDDAFEEKVILVGHSMGGAIILNSAIINPEKIQALICVSTGLRLMVAPQFLEGLMADPVTTVNAIIKYAYHPETPLSVIEEGARWMKETPRDILYNDFRACNEFDLTHEAEKIDIPALILCGEHDKLTPPKLSDKIHSSIKNSTLKIIPGAGHMLMTERPEEFNTTVLEFLASI